VRVIKYNLSLTDVRDCTDKKEKEIFLIYKEIQMGSGAESYIRKGFEEGLPYI
jgi:hypothetical protein